MSRYAVLSMLAIGLHAIIGCSATPRGTPVPAERTHDAVIAGYEHRVRLIGDDGTFGGDKMMAQHAFAEALKASGRADGHLHFLAISGGGQQGAYGAGLLVGWTETGTRPTFDYVTGISTGSLIAPFAFLGSEYDQTLEAVYTQYSTRDLVRKRPLLSALLGVSFTDPEGLKQAIATYVTEREVELIGEAQRQGRRLYIGTTNLDAMEPVYWSIGAIAVSEEVPMDERLALIRRILLASASIPAAFPPVMFEVEIDGEPYDEMHVDGGAISEVFAYPLSIDLEETFEDLGLSLDGTEMYVIRNGTLKSAYEAVELKLFPIASRSLSSLIRSQGTGDLFRLYLGTLRDGIGFNLTYMTEDFDLEPTEEFDPVYMRALFEFGRSRILEGNPWETVPPGFEWGKKGLETWSDRHAERVGGSRHDQP